MLFLSLLLTALSVFLGLHMSHSSWRTPIVPIQWGAMTSALEKLGCGTTLGSWEGQTWAGLWPQLRPAGLPLDESHLSRATHKGMQLFQNSTDVLNCYCPSCLAECVFNASETDFRANPDGAEFKGEEPRQQTVQSLISSQ